MTLDTVASVVDVDWLTAKSGAVCALVVSVSELFDSSSSDGLADELSSMVTVFAIVVDDVIESPSVTRKLTVRLFEPLALGRSDGSAYVQVAPAAAV